MFLNIVVCYHKCPQNYLVRILKTIFYQSPDSRSRYYRNDIMYHNYSQDCVLVVVLEVFLFYVRKRKSMEIQINYLLIVTDP